MSVVRRGLAGIGGITGGAEVLRIIVTLVDDVSAKSRKVTQSVATMEGSTTSSLKASSIAWAALGAAVVAATAIIVKNSLQIGMQAARIRIPFQNMVASVGVSLDELREATLGTVSDVELMAAATQAAMLGIPVDMLPDLFEQATINAQAMGITVTQAIRDISQGIGRQSRLILDNLGIIINAKKAYEDYAASIGKSVDELTEAERRIAFATAALEAMGEKSEKIGDITGTVTVKWERMQAQWDNTLMRIGNFLIPILSKVMDILLFLGAVMVRVLRPAWNVFIKLINKGREVFRKVAGEGTSLTDVLVWLAKVFAMILGGALIIAGGLILGVIAFIGGLVKIVNTVIGAVKFFVDKLKDLITWIKKLIDWIKDLIKKLRTLAGLLGDTADDTEQTNVGFRKLTGTIINLTNALNNIPRNVTTTITTVYKTIGGGGGGGGGDGGGGGGGDGGRITDISDWIPEKGTFDPRDYFQQGTPFVPRTGLAVVHRGEMIIPAPQATLIRGGGRGGRAINVSNTFYVGSIRSERDIRRVADQVEGRVIRALQSKRLVGVAV